MESSAGALNFGPKFIELNFRVEHKFVPVSWNYIVQLVAVVK